MTGCGFLTRMAEASRARAGRARAEESESRLLERALAAPEPLKLELAGFDLIAELKLRSPADGHLARSGFDRLSQVEAYARAGAAAVSVLTEPLEFKGALAHLVEAAERLRPLGCPVMRKDFLVDPYQVIEARAAGASGVLVIVAMLDEGGIEALVDCARDLGLFVLLEAFDAEDLARIERLPLGGSVLAGVNCRNLSTLEVDFERFAKLAPHLPRELPRVAESGVGSRRDVEAVARLGYDLALVGSALMRASDPSGELAALIAAGRDQAERALRCS